MKFSDVIIATVSLVLLGWILDSFLMVAFAPLTSAQTSDTLAYIISFLVISLVVGYVFALEIQEGSRTRTIGVIIVLSAFALLLLFSTWVANPFAKPYLTDSMNSMFNTSGWTDYDLAAYSALMGSLLVIIGAVVSFIGLYAGSMLRKPSAKTQE